MAANNDAGLSYSTVTCKALLHGTAFSKFYLVMRPYLGSPNIEFLLTEEGKGIVSHIQGDNLAGGNYWCLLNRMLDGRPYVYTDESYCQIQLLTKTVGVV